METLNLLNITAKCSLFAQIACRDLMKIYVCMNEGFLYEREDEELNHNKKLQSFYREFMSYMRVIKAQEIKTLFEKCYFASQNAFL